MRVELNPAIGQQDKNSLCFSIYSQLYASFFNAQQQKDDTHPFGIVEGDVTSTMLKNSAYGFAYAISGAVGGEADSSTGVLLNYLKLSGGDLTGYLRANNGFEAGVNNTKVISCYSNSENKFGVHVLGDLHVGSENLFIGNRSVLRYNPQTYQASINAPSLFLDAERIQTQATIVLGDADKGVLLSSSSVTIVGHEVFHQGNACMDTIDWKMNNAFVSGTLSVKSSSEVKGTLSALYGVNFGDHGTSLLSISNDSIFIQGTVSLMDSCRIQVNGVELLQVMPQGHIQLGAGSDLILGNDKTQHVRLYKKLTDADGEYQLLSEFGDAFFPSSLKVRHNFGDDLLSSYRVDAQDEGIVIHKRLRFGSHTGLFFESNSDTLMLKGGNTLLDTNDSEMVTNQVSLKFGLHESALPGNIVQESNFIIGTTANYILFENQVEVVGKVSISNSFTRLEKNTLYFNDSLRLAALEDKIKVYGDTLFLGNLNTENFSTGWSGRGWGITNNKTTGSYTATFDDVVVRQRLRAFELEVQSHRVVNGSLWISDSCCGDSVEEV